MWVGVVAALLAALAWSLSFIAPLVIGGYSIFDFALVEFVVSGVLSCAVLACKSNAVRALGVRDWLVASMLGLIGYVGYFLALMGATLYAGPVIAGAFLGLVPVVLAIAGNLRQRTVAWKALSLPLALAAVGLLLVNGSNLLRVDALHARSLAAGIPCAILAVCLWTCFGLLNQSALDARPRLDAGLWMALMMVGSGLGILAFLPFGLLAGVFEIPRLGLQWNIAAPLYLWGSGLAIVTNLGGALAWTFASQRLPVVLAAQLITMEPTFGTALGLCVRRQWPTPAEITGLTLLLVGVVIAVRIFHGRRNPALVPDPA